VTPPLLEVRDLAVSFETDDGLVRAVNGVSFSLDAGRTLGIVGESGSGKTVTSLAILRLIASPPGRIDGGEILFRGRNLLALPEAELRKVRGNEISMVFQEPMTSLNPVFTAGDQIEESLRLHLGLGRRAARARAIELLRKVGIAAPAERVDAYPHELSGGMRQRVMIAMAIGANPALLVADEPTTALDVTIQAQILDLLAALRAEMGMGLLLITHNLGIVAEVADHVAVMYAGRVVEQADVRRIFGNPLHPYTRGLLESIPRITGRRSRLAVIPGSVPDPARLPRGCPFHPRCPFAVPDCAEEEPALREIEPGHAVRCIRVEGPGGIPGAPPVETGRALEEGRTAGSGSTPGSGFAPGSARP
jgi:oligopeptide/dipeptide ABC transporter ATP-binding protein